MKSIEYITVRVGLKVIIIFEDDFIDHSASKTIDYLRRFLLLMYEKSMFDIEHYTHDFMEV